MSPLLVTCTEIQAKLYNPCPYITNTNTIQHGKDRAAGLGIYLMMRFLIFKQIEK